MRAFLNRSTAAALTALFLGLGVAAATTTPADAAGVWRHSGYYGGRGYGGRGDGGWWGPAIGLGILGLAAGPYYYGGYYGPGPYYGYGYDPNYGGPYYGAGYGPGPNGCTAYRPVYDRAGRYLGRRWVDICR
ncbi:MAG: hypothetical protein ABSC25_11225 [Roseiarcus sp.]|jgi:hypothetical protein